MLDVECHMVSFRQGFESVHLNRREVDENISIMGVAWADVQTAAAFSGVVQACMRP